MKAFEVIQLEGSKAIFLVRFNILNQEECNRLRVLLLNDNEKEFVGIRLEQEKGCGYALRIRMNPKSDKCSSDYVKATIEDYLNDPVSMEYVETGKSCRENPEEPAMVSHKDHELYEEVNQKVTEFYERDEENRAVFLLLMDKKTERINGCILGERKNIMSGVAHSLRRDDKLLMDIAEVTQTLLLEGAIDALNEIKDKSKK